MSDQSIEIRRTGWDVALGLVLIVAGFIALGNVVFATAVSVLLIAWVTLVSGLVALVAALFSIGKSTFWSSALSGVLLTVLGLLLLRNLAAAAVTLTLLAGAFFLSSGLLRIVAALHDKNLRWVYLFGGVISAGLGLIVLFNLFTATFVLLGTLIAIELIVDGVTLAAVGRARIVEDAAEPVGDAP